MPQSSAALIIIDMQKAMADPAAGVRNNPDAEQRIAQLLAAWRAAQASVVHVRQMSRQRASLFWPGQRGAEFQEALAPLPSEHVVEKTCPTPSSTRRWNAGCACAASAAS